MKKTNKEWLAVFYKWTSRAEALREAGIEMPYVNYSIYGSGSYLSFEFTIGETIFKKKSDENGDEAAYEAVEWALNDLRDSAIEALKARIESENKALEILKEL